MDKIVKFYKYGAIGPTGAKGDTGQNGTSWRMGTDNPTPEQGVNGDSFFNTLTGDLFAKQSGNWILQTNLAKYLSFHTYAASETHPGRDYILLVGQSNTVGQTGVVLDHNDRREGDTIQSGGQLRNSGNVFAPIPINTTTDWQLNHPDTNDGISPTVFFGNYSILNKGLINPARELWWVPCAVGGTGFEDPAITNSLSWTFPNGQLYLNALARLQLAMNTLIPGQTENYNRLLFIYFNQAEKNVGTPYERYANWWLELMFALRRGCPLTQAFNAVDRARVPIIDGQMPSGSRSFLNSKNDMARFKNRLALKLPFASVIDPDADLRNDAGEGYILITGWDDDNNTVTFARPHGFEKGKSIVGLANEGQLDGTGLPVGATLWPIPVSPTETAFAATWDDLVAGTRINITASPVGAAYMADCGTRQDDVLHNNRIGTYRLDEQFKEALPAAYLNKGNIKAPVIGAAPISPTEIVVYSDDWFDPIIGGAVPHQIQTRVLGSGEWTASAIGAKSSGFLISGLAQGQSYEVRALGPNSVGEYTLISNTVTVELSLETPIIDAAWIGANASNVTASGGAVTEWRSTRQAGATPWAWSQGTSGNQPLYLTGTSTSWPLGRPCINFSGNISAASADFLAGDASIRGFTRAKRWVMAMLWLFHTGGSSSAGHIFKFDVATSGGQVRFRIAQTGNELPAAGNTQFTSTDSLTTRISLPIGSGSGTNRDRFLTVGVMLDLEDASGVARWKTYQNGILTQNITVVNSQNTRFPDTDSFAATLFSSANQAGTFQVASCALLSGTSAPPEDMDETAKALHYYLRSN